MKALLLAALLSQAPDAPAVAMVNAGQPAPFDAVCLTPKEDIRRGQELLDTRAERDAAQASVGSRSVVVAVVALVVGLVVGGVVVAAVKK